MSKAHNATGTGEQFARMIAERKGISVEEHLRRKRAEDVIREEIAKEEGIEVKEDEMNEIDTTDLEITIKQYEEAIAFEVANPWDGTLKPRAIPYCYIPDKIKSKIEDGRADYLEEITKLYDEAMLTLQAAR